MRIKTVKTYSNDRNTIFDRFKNNPKAATAFMKDNMVCHSCPSEDYCETESVSCSEMFEEFFKTFGAKYLDNSYSFARFLDEMVVCDKCSLKGTAICSDDKDKSNCIVTWKKYLDSEGDRKIKEYTIFTRTTTQHFKTSEWEENEYTYLNPIKAVDEDIAIEKFISISEGDLKSAGAIRISIDTFEYPNACGAYADNYNQKIYLEIRAVEKND